MTMKHNEIILDLPEWKDLPNEAEAAVRWSMTTLPARWGPLTTGAETWSVGQVRKALEGVAEFCGVVVEGVLSSLLEQVEGLPEGWIMDPRSADAAKAWGWGHDKGSKLCRASGLLLAAVEGIIPGWTDFDASRHALEKAGGAAAWVGEDGEPSLALKVLTSAVAEAWSTRSKRLRAMPAPTLHPVAFSAIAASRAEMATADVAHVLARAGRSKGIGEVAGLIVPADGLDDITAAKTLSLAASLCRLTHAQWSRWEQDYSRVAVPMSALQGSGLITDRRDKHGLDSEEQALDLFRSLASARVTGLGHLIEPESIHVVSEDSGGRPGRFVVARVGDPLCPFGVIDWYKSKGLTMPDGLRYYGAAFDPAWTPLVGNKQTYAIQRAAFATGLGQWLMARREEYADRKGVKLDTLPAVLKGLGLYIRSHASLVDKFMDALRTPPVQPILEGPRSALLVPIEPGSDIYKLGDGHPDYIAAHHMLVDAAGAAQRKKRSKAIEAKRRKGA